MSILCDQRAGRAIYMLTGGRLALVDSDEVFCAVLGWPRAELAHMDPRDYGLAIGGEGDEQDGPVLGHFAGEATMPRASGQSCGLAWEAIGYEAVGGNNVLVAVQYASLFCHV